MHVSAWPSTCLLLRQYPCLLRAVGASGSLVQMAKYNIKPRLGLIPEPAGGSIAQKTSRANPDVDQVQLIDA